MRRMKQAASVGRPSRWKTACAVCVLCATTAIPSPAQTLTTLFTFHGTNGTEPFGGLVQATNGYLYGTTFFGAANNSGSVFRITPSGALTTLYSFCSQGSYPSCPDGDLPRAALVQAANGNFYGTTQWGGANTTDCGGSGCGTVFEITQGGALTTLYSFCSQGGCTDGELPAGLVQAANGNLYGTTEYGGANDSCASPLSGCGTVFKITPAGALITLYSFCSQSDCTDGEFPRAGLIQATNGDLYGTTYLGGANGQGTVFRISSTGALTTLYSFCSQSGCADGDEPVAGLVQASNGNFYGTTASGGANTSCFEGCGTVFTITPGGALTTLYSFCSQSGCTDGNYPQATLVQATDGNLYGTTEVGGTGGNNGTAFKIGLTGGLTTLYSFCSVIERDYCADGSSPFALVQETNGNFYGTTAYGGARDDGTIFSLSVGLGPFVETQPTSGAAAKPVRILGSSLTGATSVTFNGTAATFTVESSSLITTTVPAGATTGQVQVVTPSGTLSSNVPFRVLP